MSDIGLTGMSVQRFRMLRAGFLRVFSELYQAEAFSHAVSGSEAGNVPALQAGNLKNPTRTQGVALGLRAVSPLD
jgi:hypothetical protein